MTSALSFLVSAKRGEIAGLRRLALTSELVGAIGRLVHALQRERGLSAPGVLAYRDAKCGQQRALRLARDATGAERLSAFWLAGDVSGEAWLRSLLQADQTLPAPGRHLLAPGTLAGRLEAPRSPQVCACLNISERAIRAELQRCEGGAEDRLARLQSTLKCGTHCGSCVPALRKLARAATADPVTEGPSTSRQP